MGKSKKTRWRALDFDSGSQDETLTNDVDVKFNESTNLTGSTTAVPTNNNKYSQILGDHHNTNNSTSLNGKNSLTSSFTNSSYKSRSYNNKENFYNQRSNGGGRSNNNGGQKSWQRSGGNYRATFTNGKDSNKKQEENEKAGTHDSSSSTEPKRFNEDEYTRITTPRQDVLFKKGYLSRNINKTVTTTNTSTTANSTANSSSPTTSDPDSSVNSLSPATTPSMEQYGSNGFQDSEYGQQPYFYPGYGYDDSGMFVIPAMYNGYYQSPVSPGSPMIFMPYPPYPYDPIFMPPNDLPPTDVETEEKEEEVGETTVEVEGDKKESTNNDQQNDEESRNGASTSTPVSSSSPLTLDGDKCSNNQEDDGEGGDEAEEEEDEDEKKKCEDQLTDNVFEETATQNNAENDELTKQQEYPFYQNYGNYIYPNPNFSNNYFNPYYFFNGQPQRPPKMKRRKRFPSSRNQSRSTETTTDDETTTQNKFNYKYQSNGWSNAHHYPRSYFRHDQNHAGYTLNVNVEEFHPRNQMQVNPQTQTTIKNDDQAKSKVNQENSKVVKTSQANVKNSRVTKREIIQGIKSMEQQNIDLMATKHTQVTNANQDDEWNVIKKGKKVKVVRESEGEKKTIVVVQDVVNNNIETKSNDESTTTKLSSVQQNHENNNVKKSSLKVTATVVNKKTKNKGKKKKPNLMIKQDGFEIIEPEFTKPSSSTIDETTRNEGEDEDDDEEPETSNDECAEVIHNENQVLRINDKSDECIKKEIAVEKSESVVAIAAAAVVDVVNIISNDCVAIDVNDLTKAQDIEVVDTVIDISDDDIRSSKALITEILKIPKEEDSHEIVDEKQEETIIYKTQKNLMSPEVQVEKAPKKIVADNSVTTSTTVDNNNFQDSDFFNDRSNIADLERDLIENLRQYDEDIEFKSPIINPLYDFPITSAVQKWLHAKQNESFDSLFHVQNLQKLCEIYNDVNDDDEDDETESEISEKEMKSETDSDYASDFHAKTNGNSPTCSNHAKSSRSCNKLIASKESFCALM